MSRNLHLLLSYLLSATHKSTTASCSPGILKKSLAILIMFLLSFLFFPSSLLYSSFILFFFFSFFVVLFLFL